MQALKNIRLNAATALPKNQIVPGCGFINKIQSYRITAWIEQAAGKRVSRGRTFINFNTPEICFRNSKK